MIIRLARVFRGIQPGGLAVVTVTAGFDAVPFSEDLAGHSFSHSPA